MIFKSQGMMAEKLSCFLGEALSRGGDGCDHNRVFYCVPLYLVVLWRGFNHKRVHVISGVMELSYTAPFATEGTRDTGQPIPKWGLVPGSVRTQQGVTQRTRKDLLPCHFVSPLSNCSSLLFLSCENHHVLTTSALLEFPVWLAPAAAFLYTPSSTLPHHWKGDRLWSVLPKSLYLEAFRALPGIFWVLPAAVLPASSC